MSCANVVVSPAWLISIKKQWDHSSSEPTGDQRLRLIHQFLDEEMKQMSILDTEMTVVSTLQNSKEGELDAFADGIVYTMNAKV